MMKWRPGSDKVYDGHLFVAGTDPSSITFEMEFRYYRWFRHGFYRSVNGLLAFEEWTRVEND
jgi:hypothetical protein